MNLSDLRQKPLFGGTWTGPDGNARKGTCQEYLKTTRPDGPRVVMHRWLDTNEVVVSAMTGNAFTKPAGFKKYFERTRVSPTPSQLKRMLEAAAKALGEV